MDDENISKNKPHTTIAIWTARMIILFYFSAVFSAPIFGGYLILKHIVYHPEEIVSFEDVIWLIIIFFFVLFRVTYTAFIKKEQK